MIVDLLVVLAVIAASLMLAWIVYDVLAGSEAKGSELRIEERSDFQAGDSIRPGGNPSRLVAVPAGSFCLPLENPILPGGHFTWAEATRNGERMPQTPEIIANIVKAARMMERVRARLGGRPITVVSWYRDEACNVSVGGARGSQHLLGLAVDFHVAGMTPEQVYQALAPWHDGGLGRYETFTHIDARDRRARWSR